MSFGGKQQRLRDTNFAGYLGRYYPLLSVGDTQRMNWSNEEPGEGSTEGPFNLKLQERCERRSIQLLDEDVNNKPKTKKELTTDLQREGNFKRSQKRLHCEGNAEANGRSWNRNIEMREKKLPGG
ncbi:hypothetical protein IV203_010405 [Nitzschia inconspicua]|uniref:Uncharacterized protein n=1 Tax=Nitzschia inconspicua TaxID=303405 RepID=A0A9K3KXL6_9STRA|nr:hypothetical protein IV203_010405 [Nitzschia inconspicua]